jgi:hypothetical protein
VNVDLSALSSNIKQCFINEESKEPLLNSLQDKFTYLCEKLSVSNFTEAIFLMMAILTAARKKQKSSK